MINLSQETFYLLDAAVSSPDNPSLKDIASEHFGKSYDPLVAVAENGMLSNGSREIFSTADYTEYSDNIEEGIENFTEWFESDNVEQSPYYDYILYRLISEGVLPDGQYLIHFWW